MRCIKYFLTLTIIAGFMLFTGCGMEEVYEKSYLQTIYISGRKGGMTVNMHFFNTQDDALETGEDLGEIISKVELKYGKTVVTGHTEVIVLNNCDIREVLEYMLKVRKAPPSCYVVEGDEDAENFGNAWDYDVIKSAVESKVIPECGLISVLSDILKTD